jgi:short-subunit dehydrogenase involved in D-alanine esterification of teichoic acids
MHACPQTQINNAGIVGDGTSPANHEAILKTNVDGAIDITLALLPHLAPGARVVQVASRESWRDAVLLLVQLFLLQALRPCLIPSGT